VISLVTMEDYNQVSGCVLFRRLSHNDLPHSSGMCVCLGNFLSPRACAGYRQTCRPIRTPYIATTYCSSSTLPLSSTTPFNGASVPELPTPPLPTPAQDLVPPPAAFLKVVALNLGIKRFHMILQCSASESISLLQLKSSTTLRTVTSR
jgi:hypothetical protein